MEIAATEIQSASAPSRGARAILYGAVTLLSAFLLFQVQLIVAKYMLPWFGGTASVWTTCMVFFQVLLLLGYGYTHATRKLQRRRRFALHAGLLGVSVLALALAGLAWRSPITPGMAALMLPGRPTLSVLTVLLVSAGLPFWLLSTTSPLLQDWFWQTEQRPPYRLYALSNLGSLAGLLTYPVVVERTTTVFQQGWIWAGAYAAFAAGTIVCGWMNRDPVVGEPRAVIDVRAGLVKNPGAGQVAMWVALAAAGSALMLATTNFLTQDVAAVPLLWVLPLSIYLLSFVLTFHSARIYRRGVVYPLLAAAMGGLCYALARSGSTKIWMEFALASVVLLLGTLVCHGELARAKPGAQHLTAFYLWLSAGGALGSSLVALVAPRVFGGVWEYQCALFAVALLGAIVLLRDGESWARRAAAWKVVGVAAVVGLVPVMAALDYKPGDVGEARKVHAILLGVCLAAALLLAWYRSARGGWTLVPAAVAMLAGPVVLGVFLLQTARYTDGDLVTRSRNFYGVLSVFEREGDEKLGYYYLLYNGRIVHGLQSRKPELRRLATTYYAADSGLGFAVSFHARRSNPDPQERNLRVGVVGLGAGTTLSYAGPGDYFRVYDLNPRVLELSSGPTPYFTYLRDCQGKCEVVLGDARTSMQQEADGGHLQKFDVLVLDAFTGDAIPVHLLTREAFELYRKHLRDENSVLAVHISNRVLDLAPVVARLAKEEGLAGWNVDSEDEGDLIYQSDWIVLGQHPPGYLVPPGSKTAVSALGQVQPGPLWTDAFSNLVSVLRKWSEE